MKKNKKNIVEACSFITTTHNMLDNLKKQNKIIVWVEKDLSFFDKILGTQLIKFIPKEIPFWTYEMIKRKNLITRKVVFEIKIEGGNNYSSKNNHTDGFARLFWEELLEEANKQEKKLDETIKEQKK